MGQFQDADALERPHERVSHGRHKLSQLPVPPPAHEHGGELGAQDEDEDEVLADLTEEPRPASEAEDIVQDQAEGGKELAREEEEHGGAEKAGEASAPDDLAQGLVELTLVDGNDLRELVEHDLG